MTRTHTHTPEAHDENLEVHELRHSLQAEGADLAAVLVHESGIVLELHESEGGAFPFRSQNMEQNNNKTQFT